MSVRPTDTTNTKNKTDLPNIIQLRYICKIIIVIIRTTLKHRCVILGLFINSRQLFCCVLRGMPLYYKNFYKHARIVRKQSSVDSIINKVRSEHTNAKNPLETRLPIPVASPNTGDLQTC